MFRRVHRVMVAFSGGPDSLACLLLMRELGQQQGFEVVAAHFDHQLRPESAADLERARAICTDLGLSCVTGEGDVGAVAAQQHMGIEETARRMRYQFLAFAAGKEGADCLVTGHTADDQAETVLMHIIRGAGIRGLRGMAPVGEIPGAQAQRLVRPLLVLRRSETAAICAEAGIVPIEDASNADPRYTRNRLRLQTLPALREINPSVERALLNLADSARQTFADVERQSLEIRPLQRGPVGTLFDLADVRSLPAEALTLVIEREASFSKIDPAISRVRIENLRNVLNRGAGLIHMGQCIIEVSCGRVRIGPAIEQPATFEPKIIDIPGATVANPWRVDVALKAFDETPNARVFTLAPGSYRGLLRIRPPQDGDRIRYHGMRRRVSDLFINRKIPRWERLGVIAIADADGVVALIGAFGILADPVADLDSALHIRITAAQKAVRPAPRLELPGAAN